jgi:hypothetical protein
MALDVLGEITKESGNFTPTQLGHVSSPKKDLAGIGG